MVALKRVFVFVVLGILATNTDGVFAQESDELQESDFKITTSVGLSIKGFFMSTQYSLVDELGFEYDVMSLLRNPTVTEMTGVDELQYEELNDTWWLETKQMRACATF